MAEMILNQKKCGFAAANLYMIVTIIRLLAYHLGRFEVTKQAALSWYYSSASGWTFLTSSLLIALMAIVFFFLTAFVYFLLGYLFSYFYNKA